MLSVEFSRVALDGRVTLVIDPIAPRLQICWIPLAVATVDDAVEALGVREEIAPAMRSRWVGLETRHDRSRGGGESEPDLRATIAAWLESQALDAVVWTALPSRGPAGEPERPELDSLLSHLESLTGAARARAEEYIRHAPSWVRTPRRARFEEILGWLPIGEAIDGGD